MLETFQGSEPQHLTLIRTTPVSATTRIPFAILQCQSACALKLTARTLDLREGDIVLLRASQGADLLPAAPAALAVRVFQIALAKDSDFGPNELIASMLATTEDAHIVFRRINHALCDAYCDQLARLEAVQPQDAVLSYEKSTLCHLLLTELSRGNFNAMMIIESAFPEEALRHAPKTRQAAVILNYMTTNLAKVTLASTAAHFGYEPNYYSRLARQLYAKSFTEELRFIRMNQAKKLLELTTQSIADIALAVGYKNPANFDRHFKAFFGQSPTAYRRAFKP